MARALLAALAAAAAAAAVARAEWTILQDNLLTVGLGVSATDANNLVVSGGDNGLGAVLLMSDDGFATWRAAPHDTQAMYISVSMATRDAGVAGSLGFWGQTTGGSYTVDGESWNAAGERVLFSAAQSVHAFDNSTFLMFGFFQTDITNFLYGVSASFDAGKTFTYFDWKQPENVWARYGHAISRTHWVVTGGSWPATAKTPQARAGMLSERVRVHVNKAGNLETILDTSAKNKADGYVGAIAVTTDGGATWRQVYYDEGRFYFNAISCAGQQCWTVAEGPEGAWILTSTDGGFTWTEQYYEDNLSLLYIDFANPREGWVGGGYILSNTFEAVFLRTTDGGRTWTKSNTVMNAYANAIATVSSTKAYATAFLRNGLSCLLGYSE